MRDKPKVIGLICAWGCRDWIGLALRQAVEYCDEVIVNISSHSPALDKYDDGTYNIAKNFSGIKLFHTPVYDSRWKSHHSIVKARLLNEMVEYAYNRADGNWIWTLDADEFYHRGFANFIREFIENVDDEIDTIELECKMFYINAHYYLVGSHKRLFRIRQNNINSGIYFVPTQRWAFERKSVLIKGKPLHHYSMLLNPWMKRDFWKTEYPDRNQDKKVKWLDEIYKNFDLSDQDKWIRKNEQLFGIKSPWFADSFKPDENGRLYEMGGRHPEIIENSWVVGIKDFRKFYYFR